MTEERNLCNIAERIRAFENESLFTVLRNNKKEDWKNQLLDCLSDSVVLNHLKHIHPFQIFKVSKSQDLIELLVPYYLYQAYIKVDMRTKEVLSFHYSENPLTGTVPSYWDDMSARSDSSLLQVIPAPNSNDNFCLLAVGNHVFRCDIVEHDWNNCVHFTDVESYKKALKTATGAPLRIIQHTLENIDWDQIPNKGFLGNYNLLSVAGNAFQEVSLMFDLYEANKELVYVKDLIIAHLSTCPETQVKKFESKLHKSIRPIPSLTILPHTFTEPFSETHEFTE